MLELQDGSTAEVESPAQIHPDCLLDVPGLDSSKFGIWFANALTLSRELEAAEAANAVTKKCEFRLKRVTIGSKVKVLFDLDIGGKQEYAGEILKVNPNGTYNIKFEDGEVIENVSKDEIKLHPKPSSVVIPDDVTIPISAPIDSLGDH